MSDIPKIGQHNPAAVVRDLNEKIPTLKTLVAIGIYEDDSADIWSSEPNEIEKCAIILQSYACELWRGGTE